MVSTNLNERIQQYINELFYYIEYPEPYTIYPMWKYKDGKKKPIRELDFYEFHEFKTLVERDIYNFKHNQEKDELYEEAFKILMPLLEIKFVALDEEWSSLKKYLD